MWKAILAILTVALSTAGCRDGDRGPIVASAIGHPAAEEELKGATQAGLVRLDREGLVVPGVAARWAILDDGLDYIFRIDDAAGLSAATVARRLRDCLRRQRRNPDFAALAPVESIQAITGTVVEMRLTLPQPDLLPLLARPELAVGGPTPLKVGRPQPGIASLEPRGGEDAAPVSLRGERVGRAVARFRNGEAALVLGGTFADLPIARVAQLPRKSLRFDPTSGLFGFAIRNPDLSPAERDALSLAIDRDRAVAMIAAPGQLKATTIAGSVLEPPLPQRRATALALLKGRQVHVRVAMPTGPGSRLLFLLVARDWAEVGIQAQLVDSDARGADLALVDRVAPPGTLATLACALGAGCDPRDRQALINPPFIPIAAPVRWSLVAPTLDLFTENSLAAHPLDQLRGPR
jgi:peptide/nickel transport system substrate-binding protein